MAGFEGEGHFPVPIQMLEEVKQPSSLRLGLPHRPSISIEVEGLSYALGDQRVLDDVSARFRPGELAAIMGPSGSGKTSLLHLLVGDGSGKMKGSIKWNGRTVEELQAHGRGRLRGRYALIPQEDCLLSSQTPREALTFAARLRLPAHTTREKARARVDTVLGDMSLTHCADRRIGDIFARGISGGERRRVSVALELVAEPSVLMLDEPTSGLDSTTAEEVVLVLKRLASVRGLTVIATLHQPSLEAFDKLDRLVFLAQGAVVFRGTPSGARAHLARVSGLAAVPDDVNPADMIMRTLKKGNVARNGHASASSDGVEGGPASRPQRWDDSDVSIPPGVGDESEPPVDLLAIKAEPAAPAWKQTLVLLQRHLLDAVKDKHKFAGGFALKLLTTTLIGLVWLNQFGYTNDSIFPVTSALFITVALWIIDTVFRTVSSFPCSRALLSREYRNGWYSIWPSYLSALGSHLLINAVYAIVASFPVYLLVGMPLSMPSRLVGFVAVNTLLAIVGATLGLVLGCFCTDFQSAQQVVMPVIVPSLLFSGFLVPYRKLNVVFKWLYNLSPFSHALSAQSIVVFKGVVFDDCSGPLASIPPPLGCFHTGDQYLRSINADPDCFWGHVAVVAAVWLAIAAMGYPCMRRLIDSKSR